MSEQNKVVERTLIEEVWNRGTFALVEQLVSPEFRGHSFSPETDTLGTEGIASTTVRCAPRSRTCTSPSRTRLPRATRC